MCLTLRDPLEMQDNLFDVFTPNQDVRVECRKLLAASNLKVDQWLFHSSIKI